jgi:hypothetical protein
VPGMGREELPRPEGINWSAAETFLSNGTWSLVFLPHYI